MRVYLGINIMMGINEMFFYKDYWFKNFFFGNEGIKLVMIVKRYEKLIEYFYVSDRENEFVRGIRNYDKLYKVREVIIMVREKFRLNYRLLKNIVIDEVMIKWIGRLFYK